MSIDDKHIVTHGWWSRHKCLHLPWAAGVSGIVKPFKQLRVRRHSNFDHVGVRFHLKGPIVSAKQTGIMMRLVAWTRFLICHPTSLVQNLFLVMDEILQSEWRLIKMAEKWQLNNSATLSSKISSISAPSLLNILYPDRMRYPVQWARYLPHFVLHFLWLRFTTQRNHKHHFFC